MGCTGCAYRRTIPGNCHVECVADFDKIGKQPTVTPWQGSGYFPACYDEGTVAACEARSETAEHVREGVDHPLHKALTILLGVR